VLVLSWSSVLSNKNAENALECSEIHQSLSFTPPLAVLPCYMYSSSASGVKFTCRFVPCHMRGFLCVFALHSTGSILFGDQFYARENEIVGNAHIQRAYLAAFDGFEREPPIHVCDCV